MKIAVTGATGFVGRHLVRSLVAGGHEVTALVRNPRAAADALGPRVRCVGYDLAKAEAPTEALRGAEAVVHAAAYLPASYADPELARACLDANALGTLSLARACVAASVSSFVLFSSGNAYRRTGRAVSEDDALYPAARATYYLASKLCGELYATHACAQGGVRSVVLRPSAIYGAKMAGGLVPTLARKLAAGESVTLRDGGAYEVDLVCVEDVVRATTAALTREVRGPYNVGSGAASTTLQVAVALAELLGANAGSIVVEPAGSSPVDEGFSPLDVARACRDLGYAPTSLRDGLRAYVEAM